MPDELLNMRYQYNNDYLPTSIMIKSCSYTFNPHVVIDLHFCFSENANVIALDYNLYRA